jgi:small subunit ribosomal protein S6
VGYKTKRKEMNNYETLFILKPTLTDEETSENIKRIETTLIKEGSKVLAINRMGMKKLAYPIAKYERGFYVVIYFRSVGSVIGEFERKLKFNEDVIKFLTIKYSNKKETIQFEKLVAIANKSLKRESVKLEKISTNKEIETET